MLRTCAGVGESLVRALDCVFVVAILLRARERARSCFSMLALKNSKLGTRRGAVSAVVLGVDSADGGTMAAEMGRHTGRKTDAGAARALRCVLLICGLAITAAPMDVVS